MRRSENRSQQADDHFASPLADAPALLIFLSVILFSVIRYDRGLSFASSLIASGAIVFGLALFGTDRANKGSFAAALFVLVLSLLSAWRVERAISAPADSYDGTISGSGVVVDIRTWGRRSVLFVEPTDETGSEREMMPLVVELRSRRSISPGSVISFYGEITPFERGDGGFDEFLFWKRRGAKVKIARAEVSVVRSERVAASLRRDIASQARETLPPLTAGHLTAAILGIRDERVAALHRDTGTSHILAVSGLHVAIVYALFSRILRGVPLRSVIVSVILWAYVALTGAPASAVRAASMLQLVVIGKLFGRSGRPFNTAAAAGWIMLLVEPWIFWDVGWRLSMLAIMSVISSVSVRDRCLGGMSVPVALPLVWLITNALSISEFGPAPISGLILNIFAIPFFSFMFPFAFVCSLPAFFGVSAVAARVPEACFAAWETFATNILNIVPDTLAASTALFVAASACAAFAFSIAAGCDKARSCVISGISALAPIFI